MSPVEKLQAAIDKLTMLKEQSTPRWARSHDYTPPGELALCFHDLLDADAELVLTLHRTIDAQLAILRDDYDLCKREDWIPNRYVLMLAESILGAGS